LWGPSVEVQGSGGIFFYLQHVGTADWDRD
jgi:hypothetical protein